MPASRTPSNTRSGKIPQQKALGMIHRDPKCLATSPPLTISDKEEIKIISKD